MSNDGTWQPPHQGGTTPPPPSRPQAVPAPPPPPTFGPPPTTPGPTGPGTPAGPEAPLTAAGGAAPSGSKGKLIAVVVGALVLVAAGIFAITRLGGGDSSAGGADSPEAAGQAVLDAVGDEDVLGMIDVLLPGERETMREPATDLAEELTRLEVLSDDASLSDVGGVEVAFSNTAVDVEPTNADDVVNLRLHGDVSVAVDGEALPIGDIVYDNVPEADPAQATVEATEPVPFDVPITAVRKDDRWYVSLFYSVAESARAEAAFDIPADAIVPTGGDSPEDAVDAFLAGAEALDLRAIVASLNPNEFEALQRYGPAFLDEAQQEIDTAGVELTLDEADYDVQGEGERRSVAVTYLSGAITADGETVPFEYEDGCVRATSPDGAETIDSCTLADPAATDVFGADAEAVADLMALVEAAMADYENPGVIVQQVDGTWYLSPMATSAEQVLAFLRALDREEIESIGSEIADLFGDVMDDLSSGGLDIPSEVLEGTGGVPSDVSTPEPVVPQTTMPDAAVDEEGAPAPTSLPGASMPDSSAGDECYAAVTAVDATACFEALMATGELAPSAVPIYLRAPECGLAGPYWEGELFSLGDAEFIAAVSSAAPCFQALVADGTLDELDLPLELSHPECLEGRNWYGANDDEAYFDRLFECAYG